MKTITLDQWRNTHIDYKGYIDGQPYLLTNDPKTGETISEPVEVDRSIPPVISKDKFIGAITQGIAHLPSDTLSAIYKEFHKQVLDHEDYFYCLLVHGNKYYVQKNGEIGYTAMLPDEHQFTNF